VQKNALALSLVLGCIVRASVAFGAAHFETVTIGFSSFSGFYGPLWLAVEDGLGKKYGLDLRAYMQVESDPSNCSPAARRPS
jgi:ABC-type nitrate/sulfonate/bicarbonate transport system substrate-binding protein